MLYLDRSFRFALFALLGGIALYGCDLSNMKITVSTPTEAPQSVGVQRGSVRSLPPEIVQPEQGQPGTTTLVFEPGSTSGISVASRRSDRLQRNYAALEGRLRRIGHLRENYSPADAPLTSALLAQNFEKIAFFTERGFSRSGRITEGGETALSRWQQPVRITPFFGESIRPEVQKEILEEISSTAARLRRGSNHPVSLVARGGNIRLMVLSEDDRVRLGPSFASLFPDLDRATLSILRNPDPAARCFVIGLGDGNAPNIFSGAVVFIRAELPDALRMACIEEELAQGMGLANDSDIRPSIFNDNDEFSRLTQHDEFLLRILYDDRLKPGMRRTQAMPIVNLIAAELVEGRGLERSRLAQR